MWQVVLALVAAVPIAFFIWYIIMFFVSFLAALAGIKGLTHYYRKKGKLKGD